MSGFSYSLEPARFGADILAHIARGQKNGTLSWREGETNYDITFCQGRAQSGRVAAQPLDATVQALATVLRGFAVRVSGACEFFADNPSPNAPVQLDTLGEAAMAVLEDLSDEDLERIWQVRGGVRVSATAAFNAVVKLLYEHGGALVTSPDPGTPLVGLDGSDTSAGQRTWLTLRIVGGVAVGQTAGAAQTLEEPMDPPPSDPTLRVRFEEVYATHARWVDKSHYEILGIEKNAGGEAIRDAYFAAAKKWHRDRYAGDGFGENTLKYVDDLFQRCETAYRILNDKEERKTYDYAIERQALGLPTDPKVIMRAEKLFRKAQTLVRRGNPAAAEPLLRDAITLNKGEADFWVYFGYALYCAKGKEAIGEAREAIQKGLKMNPKLDAGHEFLGRIARVEGELAQAKAELREALELNPDNIDAARELRFLGMRAEKEGGKGTVLGKIFRR